MSEPEKIDHIGIVRRALEQANGVMITDAAVRWGQPRDCGITGALDALSQIERLLSEPKPLSAASPETEEAAVLRGESACEWIKILFEASRYLREVDTREFRLDDHQALQRVQGDVDRIIAALCSCEGLRDGGYRAIAQQRDEARAERDSLRSQLEAATREAARLKSRNSVLEELDESTLQEAITCGRAAERLKLTAQLEAAEKKNETWEWAARTKDKQLAELRDALEDAETKLVAAQGDVERRGDNVNEPLRD
jgi:hypothetical protein